MTHSRECLVGYEATSLELQCGSGVSRYTEQLLNALVEHGAGWRYALLACKPLACAVPREVTLATGPRIPNRSLWFQFVLPRIIAHLRPRLCHFTNSLAPLSLSCPFIVTLHDMSLFLFPELQPKRSLWLVRSILPAVAGKAAGIVTVSDSAKRDIVRVLQVKAEKVHVVDLAAAPEYRVIVDKVALDSVRRKYGLESPFVLFVGTLEPRKNLPRLIEAFSRLRRHGRAENLVLAGRPGPRYRSLLRQIEERGLKDCVRVLGYVPREDLPGIYNAAQALAFPSLYEGFGLPILESMACGTPVLTGNRGSMAVLGDEAAVLVDPLSEQEIEHGLHRMLSDERLRQELREAGLARASRYSWRRAALETTRIYERLIR